MTYDAGFQESARQHLMQSLRLAEASGRSALGAVALATFSDQERYGGDPHAALDLARAGQRIAGDAPDVRARCRLAEARALAALVRGGDRSAVRACVVALGHAEKAVGDGARGFEYLPGLDEGKFATEEAHACLDVSFSLAGTWPARASAAAQRGLNLRDASFVRSRSLTKLTLGRAHLRQGNVDHACALGGEVLQDVQGLASTHPEGYLRAFGNELRPFVGHPDVDDFREQLRLALAEQP